MKIKDIITKANELSTIMEKKLPIGVAFCISRNTKKLAEVLDDFEKKRIDIIKKYAEKDENGEVVVSQEGNAKVTDIQAANAELTELMDVDVSLSFDTFSLADLERCNNAECDLLTPAEIGYIDFMIGEEKND